GVVVTDQRIRPVPKGLPVSLLVSRRLPRLPLAEPRSKRDFRAGGFSEQERAAFVQKPVDVAEHGLRSGRAEPVNGVGDCFQLLVARPPGLTPRPVILSAFSGGSPHSPPPL